MGLAIVAYQASPRGGVVRVRLAGDRVKLGGQGNAASGHADSRVASETR
jgi:hypothetical protein